MGKGQGERGERGGGVRVQAVRAARAGRLLSASMTSTASRPGNRHSSLQHALPQLPLSTRPQYSPLHALALLSIAESAAQSRRTRDNIRPAVIAKRGR